MRTVDPARHLARRNQILASAATAFADRGYDNTTVKDLCAAAGVGSGTLFHYFADKRAVFHALLEEDRDTTIADLRQIIDPDPATRLWLVVERLNADLKDPAAGQFMLAILGQAMVDPQIAEILGPVDKVAEEILRKCVAELIAADQVSGWEPSAAATWIRSIVDGTYLRCAEDGFDAVGEAAIQRQVISRMLGLETPE